MKTKKLSLLAKTLVALALSATLTSFADNAKAQTTLFDNGSASGELTGGYYADAGFTFTTAGNIFTPSASGTANVVDFAGLYYNNGTPVGSLPTDDFTLSLYSVTAGAPDTLISSSSLSGLTRTSLGVSTMLFRGLTTYEYSGVLNTPFALNTSSSYYLGISDLTTPSDQFAVVLTTTPGLATDEYSLSSSGFLPASGHSLSFDLKTAPVPEPSTYALCGLGALALVIIYRRKQTA